MNGFMAGNKKLAKITLSSNMLNNLEILSQMFINKVLKEIVLVQQSYFKTSLMSVGKTADDGNVSVFTERDVKVYKEADVLITYKGKPTLVGRRDERGRYRIPLVQ